MCCAWVSVQSRQSPLSHADRQDPTRTYQISSFGSRALATRRRAAPRASARCAACRRHRAPARLRCPQPLRRTRRASPTAAGTLRDAEQPVLEVDVIYRDEPPRSQRGGNEDRFRNWSRSPPRSSAGSRRSRGTTRSTRTTTRRRVRPARKPSCRSRASKSRTRSRCSSNPRCRTTTARSSCAPTNFTDERFYTYLNDGVSILTRC